MGTCWGNIGYISPKVFVCSILSCSSGSDDFRVRTCQDIRTNLHWMVTVEFSQTAMGKFSIFDKLSSLLNFSEMLRNTFQHSMAIFTRKVMRTINRTGPNFRPTAQMAQEFHYQRHQMWAEEQDLCRRSFGLWTYGGKSSCGIRLSPQRIFSMGLAGRRLAEGQQGVLRFLSKEWRIARYSDLNGSNGKVSEKRTDSWHWVSTNGTISPALVVSKPWPWSTWFLFFNSPGFEPWLCLSITVLMVHQSHISLWGPRHGPIWPHVFSW